MYLKSQGYLKVPNDLKIGESHPIDEHLRPIKVGGKSTAIEVAQCDDGMRVRGNMEIMGDLRTDSNLIASDNMAISAGGHVEFDNCAVGFDLQSLTATSSMTADFRLGNKILINFADGNITSINAYFPATSGNFVLLLKQDGTGSRTVTNYKTRDSEGNAAAGAATFKFAGGSNPTLTTDANHVDIVSIFWDADNEIAYAVPTLDFQF